MTMNTIAGATRAAMKRLREPRSELRRRRGGSSIT